MNKSAVMIAEADEALRQRVKALLLHHGCEVIESSDKAGVLPSLQDRSRDLVIVGSSRDSPWDGLEVAKQIRRRDRRVPIILITASSSEEMAIAALRVGISDYFKHPVPFEELLASVTRCLADVPPRESSVGSPTTASGGIHGPRLIGESLPMREIRAYIGQVASTDTTVLITGETGTGKELAAELIHSNSPRFQKPFVCINCAAIPDSLLEGELFGYERGAFTGAHTFREGKLKLAEGGTTFFDEIGDMSAESQAKILRAIESKEVHRLGGKGRILLNVRVIAATNQDLEQRVTEGTFRNDLYFRLNVARIHLPPLRDRKQDIPPLFDHYIRELNDRVGREVEGFTEEALEPLLRYDWPGNVRELKNLLEAVFVTLHTRRISFMDLPEQFRRRLGETEGLPEDERKRLLSALFATKWNKSQAAQKLHWSRMTLYRKMAKYNLLAEKENLKEARQPPRKRQCNTLPSL